MKLNDSQLAELVRSFQRVNGLVPDGIVGPLTTAAIERSIREHAPQRCWPLRALPDGRRPRVTSGYFRTNPSRPTHSGADLFYEYRAGDPPMKVGDGGRTAKWWIPDATVAVATEAGHVEVVGDSKTGWRVWLRAGANVAIGYFHLSSVLVAKGQTLVAGDPIGIVGDNPVDGDARHLHFEVYGGALASYPAMVLDPEAYLRGAEILPASVG